MIAPIDADDISDHRERSESTEPSDSHEPMENSDSDDPMLPIEAKDPTLPIDRKDPREPMLRNEFVDHSDSREPFMKSAMSHVLAFTAASGLHLDSRGRPARRPDQIPEPFVPITGSAHVVS